MEAIECIDETFLRGFGRHFVSLACDHCQPKKLETFDRFVASGFLLSIHDVWFLATAGHVITDIDRRIKQEPQRTYSFAIIDNFGPEAAHEHSIPFDYENATKWASDVDDSGADFGLILIEPYYRRLIEQNHPMPFTEAQWRYTRHDPFEFHAIMGIPAETLSKDDLDCRRFKMAMIPVKEIMQLPSSIEPRQYPTFYAEISSDLEIESIKGMSGCPIFGFAKDQDGNWRYWIIAIQSTWYPERNPRIIAASFFKPLATTAEAYFDGILNESGDDDRE
jgi:hypothetical protein